MPQLPLLTGEQLVKILQAKGFALKRTKGSHHILVSTERKITVSVPVHSGKELGRGITSAIIKDAGISVEEAISFL